MSVVKSSMEVVMPINLMDASIEELAIFFGVIPEKVSIVPARVVAETLAGEASME